MLFDEMGPFVEALQFASDQHQHQRRKGHKKEPYINHLIEVVALLWRVGGMRDTTVLTAALLHDVIEDTDATPQQIESIFGKEVCRLVLEVSDDQTLPGGERKRLQIIKAPRLSLAAKQIKLADKISNVRALRSSPPAGWSVDRQWRYVQWAEQVVHGLAGINLALEDAFAEEVRQTAAHLKQLEQADRAGA